MSRIYWVIVLSVWMTITALDASRGEWWAVAYDVFLVSAALGAVALIRGKKAEGGEVRPFVMKPPEPRIVPAMRGVDNLDLPATDLAKKGVEPMPTPGDEFQRLVEEHIKGCRTCQVHEEGKNE